MKTWQESANYIANATDCLSNVERIVNSRRARFVGFVGSEIVMKCYEKDGKGGMID